MSLKQATQRLQLALNRAGVTVTIETRRYYSDKRHKIASYYIIYQLVPDRDDPDKRKRVLIYEGGLLANGVKALADLYRTVTDDNQPANPVG